jgi:hypothetical protein
VRLVPSVVVVGRGDDWTPLLAYRQRAHVRRGAQAARDVLAAPALDVTTSAGDHLALAGTAVDVALLSSTANNSKSTDHLMVKRVIPDELLREFLLFVNGNKSAQDPLVDEVTLLLSVGIATLTPRNNNHR